MSSTTKALIITWMIIGFLVIGAVGFYLGRVTAPKNQAFPIGQPQNQQQSEGNQPAGNFQQQPGGAAPQQPQGNSQQQGSFQQQQKPSGY
ncbi:hypothetical protein L6272_04940 [Microgenomates group bacterium]|nr:hypothetical protein [Microgenomates group bacterium]